MLQPVVHDLMRDLVDQRAVVVVAVVFSQLTTHSLEIQAVHGHQNVPFQGDINTCGADESTCRVIIEAVAEKADLKVTLWRFRLEVQRKGGDRGQGGFKCEGKVFDEAARDLLV